MLRRSATLEEFDRDHARKRTGSLSFHEALAFFEGLWAEAQELDPEFPSRWHDRLDADLAVARAVNGLPPEP